MRRAAPAPRVRRLFTLEGVLRHYGQLLVRLPGTLMDAATRWLTIATVFVSGLAALVLAARTDVPPWVALAPIVLLIVHGLLRASYIELAEAREKAARTDAAEEQVALLRQEVEDWLTRSSGNPEEDRQR
jgi:hypothetical protein